MNDAEAIEMMSRCREEIRGLRMRIDNLQPKAQAWDQLCKVLNLLPERSQGFEPDLVWTLEKRIEELRQSETKPESQEA